MHLDDYWVIYPYSNYSQCTLRKPFFHSPSFKCKPPPRVATPSPFHCSPPAPPTTTARPRPTSGAGGFQKNKHNAPYSLFHSFSLFFLCSGFTHTMAKASDEVELCFPTRRTTKTVSTLLSWLRTSSASLLSSPTSSSRLSCSHSARRRWSQWPT